MSTPCIAGGLSQLAKDVADLAKLYVAEVNARNALGDSQAEYHSRDIKIRAHRLLLAHGFSAREVVETFNKAVEAARSL